MENFQKFVLFDAKLDKFRLKNCIYFFSKHAE